MKNFYYALSCISAAIFVLSSLASGAFIVQGLYKEAILLSVLSLVNGLNADILAMRAEE